MSGIFLIRKMSRESYDRTDLNDKFTQTEQLVCRLYKRRMYYYGFSLNEISEVGIYDLAGSCEFYVVPVGTCGSAWCALHTAGISEGYLTRKADFCICS